MLDYDAYRSFIEAKSQVGGEHGFEPTFMPDAAYDFQEYLIDWSTRQGRSAVFADCGLGKTLMQLAWALNVVRHENQPVLILAPLSVAMQTVDEAGKFDMPARRSQDGLIKPGDEIVTANYERLSRFNPDDFAGVVCDESSILKDFDGSRKAQITEFVRKAKFRLLCTATPSPNDYVELGTSSEALGYLGYMDMLSTFFTSNDGGLHPVFGRAQWRFKRHAERQFWRWMCSWARAVRKPSDLGFDDGPFVLPALREHIHIVESEAREGLLFPMPATDMRDELAERRISVRSRCERAAEILSEVDVGVAWAHLNDEADLLTSIIPGAEQIAGKDPDERKEELFRAFRSGEIKKLVTKPKIAALGVNWQHACTMTYFPDHSFERYYQAVRRLWRFGQSRPVDVHNITTEPLSGAAKNLGRKSEAAETMFQRMTESMNDALRMQRLQDHAQKQETPAWL